MKPNAAAFIRHIGQRTLVTIDLPSCLNIDGEAVYPLNARQQQEITNIFQSMPRIDVSKEAKGLRLEALIVENLYFILRRIEDGPNRDYLDEVFVLPSTLDPDTLKLFDKHRLMLRNRIPETDPQRIELEKKLREQSRNDPYMSWENLAWKAMEEVENEKPIQKWTIAQRCNLIEKMKDNLRKAGY